MLIYVPVGFISFIVFIVLAVRWIVKREIAVFGKVTLVVMAYLLVSSFHSCTPSSIHEKTDQQVLYIGSEDYLLGVDNVYFYKDSSFKMIYADAYYEGEFEQRGDTLFLDYSIDVFNPFREIYFEELIFNGDFSDIEGNHLFTSY